MHTIRTTEDVVNLYAGSRRHIDHRSACIALKIAAAIDITYASSKQINDRRSLVEFQRAVGKLFFILSHADAVVTAGTEYHHRTEVCHAVRDVDEHIAAILSLVTSSVAWVAGTAAKDTGDGVHTMIIRTYINEGTVLERLIYSLIIFV